MPEENWQVRPGLAGPVVKKYGFDGRFARILASRARQESVASYLDRGGALFDPSLLLDADKAARLLIQAFAEKKKVCILGDYDVDGMMSSTILYLGLKAAFPHGDVFCRIPDRVSEGYGFSLPIAQEICQMGAGLVITCDNGISSLDCGPYLKEKGVSFIVTDHHEIIRDEAGREVLPLADAVIDPHREGDRSPQKTICGAFVAFQVIRQLFTLLNAEEGRQGADGTPDSLLQTLMGYAAMGTVCDIMPLTLQNRKLVYQGLSYLNEHPTLAVRCLMNVSGTTDLTSESVGFYIGPMINAGGRLKNQQKFLDLFLTNEEDRVMALARELSDLNHERQDLTSAGQAQAEQILESREDTGPVKVIYLPDANESVAGLIAGKIKEKYHRPCLVVTKSSDGLKGSGRSIEAYPMYEELARIRPFFSKMGGHAMAAGFSIACEEGQEEAKVQELSDLLNQQCSLTKEDLKPTVEIDSTMPASLVTEDWIRQLKVLEPFGKDNPEPLLAEKNVHLLKARAVGAKQNVVQLMMQDEYGLFDAVCFHRDMIEQVTPITGQYLSSPVQIDIVYSARLHTYQGISRPQIVISHIRPSQSCVNLI